MDHKSVAEVSAPEGIDTREKLLIAARKLFSVKGFAGTTVKELADHAGVNVSLVSYHFGGKEGLYRTCIEQFGQARLDFARRVLQPAKSDEEFRVRLRMFVDEMLRCHVEEKEATQMIHRECDSEVPIIEDIFRNTFLKVFETLVQFFVAAKNVGMSADHVDAEMAARIFWGGLIFNIRTNSLNEKFFACSLDEIKFRERFVEQLILNCSRGFLNQPLVAVTSPVQSVLAKE